MFTRPRRLTRAPRRRPAARLAALVGVLTTPLVGGCFAEPSPEPTAAQFLLAWQSGNYGAAPKMTTGDRNSVESALNHVREQLDLAALSFRLDRVTKDGEQGTARF